MSSVSDTSANWSSLQLLLQQALAMPVAERMQWLERAPEIPDLLREPLRRLLEVEAGADARGFLTLPPGSDAESLPATSVLIGDLIGPYRVLQEIGDGGMGSVWLAERADGSLKRKVALKLPRLTWAKDLARRMARERDILCSLEHPNIARLYDAGVDQHGRPFLALEYVEGQRLDSYCDERCLTIRQRLALFLQVLDAVQYAHVNLVLHRDLKPANILVNQRGEVRLLDFGIAKLLDESGDRSDEKVEQGARTLSRAMTPRYASPEQIQQERLTLASDIYSLGVVLFELLAGSSPVITANGSRAELELAVLASNLKSASGIRVDPEIARKRQTTPERLKRILRGELDAVLHRAMARNPSDRYVSAEAFRADIVRWLEGRPVIATPPSRLRALHKFVVRNALGVGLGTAAVITILAVATVAVMQAREARQEWRRATATRDFLLGLFESANPELHGGREMTARELLMAGEKDLYVTLKGEPETQAEILRAFADAWGRLGDFEKMAAVASKRAQITRQSQRSSLYLRALLDEAQIAAGRHQLAGVQEKLNVIEMSLSGTELPSSEKSDLQWLRGWVKLNQGNYPVAVSMFSESVSDLEETDFARLARGGYGRMIGHFRLNDRESALKSFRETISFAKKIDSSGEKIRRSFEIVAALYELGEYSEGWGEMDALFHEATSTYDPSAETQQALYMYWCNWAIKVGQAVPAREWVKNHQTRLRENSSTSEALLIDWRLTELRLAIAMRDFKNAYSLIRSLKRDSLTADHRRTADILIAEYHLRSEDPEKTLSVFSSSDWVIDPSSEETLSKEWLIYKSWLEGLALEKLGNLSVGCSKLHDGAVLSASEIGETHPVTRAVELSKILCAVREKKYKQLSPSLIRDAVFAEEGLARSFPSSVEIVVNAKEFVISLNNYQDPSSREKINSLSKALAFL